MRVISGKYRGKVLTSFEGNDIRPTIDRVKESIFNVIQFDIANASFLDLFAGTGSIGIEALSRGADVIFNDLKTQSLSILKKNLIGINDKYTIFNKDYKDALLSLNKKMDFIFIDAPFKMDVIEEVLDIVYKKDILNEDGYIIYEHDNKKVFSLDLNFYIDKTKTFGNIVVDYIKRAKTKCAVTGSFDPITLGHVSIIDKALEMFDKVLVVAAQNEEKESFFTLDERVELIKNVYAENSHVYVDKCDGFIFEYLNDKNIDIIVRGYRSDKDLAYEEYMAKYNKENGNINTLLYKAESMEDISSTKVRAYIEENKEIKGLVPKQIIKLIKKIRGEKS